MPGDDFSTLFELLPIGAYRTDASSRQLRANRAMVRIFGFASEEEMLSHARAAAQGWYVDPNRRAEFRRLLESQGSVRDFVSEMRRHGTGETFWISENAHLVRDAGGHVLYHEGTVEDITERKLAEDALQVTLEHAGRGIARVSPDGRLTLYNRYLLDLLELPESFVARKPYLHEVIRFQQERGDFGEDHELLDEAALKSFVIEAGASAATVLGRMPRYLRRTRKGVVLEIDTQSLPDGGVVRTFSDVTAYVKAEEALAEKSRALQITLDSMSQGISAIDGRGRVAMWNRRYQELLGFPDELMASRPTLETLVRFQIDRGDFGDQFSFVDAVARGYVSVGDKVPPLQGPETYLRRTSDGRTLEVRTRPLPDGGVVRTFTDMTAYVQTQEALAHKEAQLRALVSNLPDRVWLKDPAGVFQLSNPAHWRYHGRTEDAIVGHNAADIFGAEVAAHHRATDLQAMAMDQPLHFEERLLVAGRWQFVEIVKVAMRDETGQCIGVLGIARDITDRKQAEAALIAAKEAAEAGERAKAEFLANMSHEIRTPMNAVIGMSDLLLDSPLTPSQREFAETIRTSGDALLSLINDILDFSKIESGHLTLEHVPVPLVDCVEGALDLTSAAAAAKGLDLLYWIEDDVPRTILGDMTRLRQVFVNLLSNAVKFTAAGEVLVRLSRREDEHGRPVLHASVRDTGIGIPAERMDRLFQVFSQVDTSTTRRFGGTGLGLAICRRLVNLMGGRIWVQSREGEGSDFQFQIPIEAASLGPQPYVSRRPANLAGRRLLVVDDNATNRDLLTLQTRRWGLQTQAASSGLEALGWVDAGQVFDAALLDVQMPGMDGYMLAAELRRRAGPEDLPLLLLTSLGASVNRPDLRLAGTLTKPVKTQALFDALSGLFGKPHSPVSAPVPLAPLVVAEGPKVADEHPLRLLLAEDNVVNQRVAALLLGKMGYEVAVVEDGQAMLDAVRSAADGGRPFDVVLMDVQMPVLDGLAASRRLRELYPSPTGRPWIIAMTANAMEGDRDECLAAGMDDYLSKPIRPAVVVEALKRAARERLRA